MFRKITKNAGKCVKCDKNIQKYRNISKIDQDYPKMLENVQECMKIAGVVESRVVVLVFGVLVSGVVVSRVVVSGVVVSWVVVFRVEVSGAVVFKIVVFGVVMSGVVASCIQINKQTVQKLLKFSNVWENYQKCLKRVK